MTRITALLLPFAAGYFLSYLFRTINGPISDRLVQEFGLGPQSLGTLTSLYFLAFAAFQIPAGLLIDRHGPRRVQASLLVVAALGAATFAVASGPATLMLGRALIGLGTSAALVTGLKAIVLWLPEARRTSANAWLVACGGLGAIASTVPLDAATGLLGWRAVFVILAVAAVAVAALVWRHVPDQPKEVTAMAHSNGLHETWQGLGVVFQDSRFWRVAPLSASVVGAAFAIHGLWAARWLGDVWDLSAHDVTSVLLAMGLGLTAGASLFGILAGQTVQRGIGTQSLFGATCLAFMAVEAAVVAAVPVPPVLLLGVFGAFGAVTVLSFSLVGGLFPPSLAGRANGALNVLHLGTAFLMQAGIGAIVSLWPARAGGHAPVAAYAAAFGCLIAVQATAFVWFLVGCSRGAAPAGRHLAIAEAQPE